MTRRKRARCLLRPLRPVLPRDACSRVPPSDVCLASYESAVATVRHRWLSPVVRASKFLATRDGEPATSRFPPIRPKYTLTYLRSTIKQGCESTFHDSIFGCTSRLTALGHLYLPFLPYRVRCARCRGSEARTALSSLKVSHFHSFPPIDLQFPLPEHELAEVRSSGPHFFPARSNRHERSQSTRPRQQAQRPPRPPRLPA